MGCKAGDLEQVGGKERERAHKQYCMLMLDCAAENIGGDQ